jgi:uncharacterized membrane protein (DUF373 family)
MEDKKNELNKTEDRKEVAFYFWIHSAFRKYIEIIMDFILIGLVLVTLFFIMKTIYLLGLTIYRETNIPLVISEFLFIFILIEIIRILIIYIEHHHVSVDIMVELTIVAILREIILKGPIKLETLTIVGISLLIVVLGLLLRYGGIRKKVGDDIAIYEPFFKIKT